MVVSSSKDKEPSYKIKTAIKYGIPVVSVNFVSTCIEKNKLLNADDFIVYGEKPADSFRSGKIVATGESDLQRFL